MTNNILLGIFKAVLYIEINYHQRKQEEANLETKKTSNTLYSINKKTQQNSYLWF